MMGRLADALGIAALVLMALVTVASSAWLLAGGGLPDGTLAQWGLA